MQNLKRSKGDPLIPSDAKDPTGIGRIRGGAITQLNKRFAFISSQIKSYLLKNLIYADSVAENASNGKTGDVFYYVFGDDEYQDFADFVRALLSKTLLGGEMALRYYSPSDRYSEFRWMQDWWMNVYLSRAIDTGLKGVITSAKYQTATSTVDKETASLVAKIDSDQIINSPSYQSEVRTQQRAAFYDTESLTAGLATKLAETLRQAVNDGLGKTEIINKTTESIIESDEKGKGTSLKRARLMVRNRLNNAKRESDRANVDKLNNELYVDSEFEMRLLWFSALMPNRTRKWHGRRHSNIYTTKEVNDFYSEGGDRYNCYCDTTPILVNKKTGERVVDSGLQERMEKQRKDFIDFG